MVPFTTAFLVPLLVALPAGAQEPAPQSGSATSVLFVTLEATRADRLGSAGYEGARTPTLDGLAARGMRFERAYAHAPLTLPAHASLFSGRTPLETGLHDDGRAALSVQVPLLAEVFLARGYRTGAFASSLELDQIFGLARGFETYHDELGAPADLKATARTRTAREVSSAATEWLRAERERPFFCWIQFSDPRAPYEPPSELKQAIADRYDGELAHADQGLAKILETIRSLDIEDHTLVVVAGSTGESLGDHGEATHGALLGESAVRVPLFFALPGRVAAGRSSQRLVGQCDVAPTILALLGWEELPGASGASFAPELALEAGDVAQAEPGAIYIESELAARCFGWSTLRALVETRWKYVHSPTPALYDLGVDPGEQRNLVAEEPAIAARLRTALAERIAAGRARAARAIPIDAPEVSALAAIDTEPPVGAPPDALPEGQGVDPHERIAAFEHYREALERCYAGQPFAMVEPLEAAVRASPDTPVLHTQLAIAYERSRRFEGALAELELALELDPSSSTANYYMGRLQIETGHPEAAEPYYQLAAELAPDSFRAQLAMAVRLDQEGRHAEVLPYLRRVCELRATQASYWERYTALLRETRAWSELARALGEAAERASEQTLHFRNFEAWVRATCPDESVRDPARALAIARELAETTRHEDPGVLDTLSAALAANGEFDAAEEIAAKGIGIAHRLELEPLLTDMRARLELYRVREVYREAR